MLDVLLHKCAVFDVLAGPSPEYIKQYMRDRYHSKRQGFIDHLGGKCVNCGSKKNLHLDHIDKKKKTMRMSDAHSVADARVKQELKNIQLLCEQCHKEKTHKSWDYSTGKPQHGTYWMYRKYNCRCKKCIEANKARRKTASTQETLDSHINLLNQYGYTIVGRGSARLAFSNNPNTVIKLAWNQKGIAQNRQEYLHYLMNPEFVATIFNHSKDFSWIESEKLKPIKYLGELDKALGVEWKYFEKAIFGPWPLPDELWTFRIKNNPKAMAFLNFIKENKIGDTLRPNQYGLNSDGDVKLLDAGLSEEVFNKYYADNPAGPLA